MAPELRPLIVASAAAGLLVEPVIFKAELPASLQTQTNNDSGGRHRLQRAALAEVSARLEVLPRVFVEMTNHRREAFPQLAVSIELADPRDEGERRARADEVLDALASPSERLDAFALAHWAVRGKLGSGFEAKEYWDAYIFAYGSNYPYAGTMATVRGALGPWLSGRIPVNDLASFSQFHTGLSDEARVLCLIALTARDNLKLANLTLRQGASSPLVALLPTLAADGWLIDAGAGAVYKPGPKLRRLARYEALVY